MQYEFSKRISGVKGSAIREILKYTSNPDVISLAGGNPAPELFPNKELADIARDALLNEPVKSLQYGITEGLPQLRDKIKERLSKTENLSSEKDELIVVSGGQQGIELSSKVLLNEGDTVIAEDPSFVGALNAFRSYGVHIAGVPVEDDGMNIEALKAVIKENKNVKLIYTIPTFQNPTGTTMPLAKRKALYEIAKENNLIIIEDNPYGELTFTGEKVPTIKSLDTEGIVIYCGSFSKILAPGLRVGFMYAPKEIIAKAVIAKQVSDVHSAALPQILALEFLTKFDIDSLILKMRANYAHKCKTMLDAIDEYFPKGVYHTSPKGGLFIWCDLKGGIDTIELSKKAIEKKVAFVPGSTFMADMEAPCSALRLNYSTMSDEKIVEGIKILGELFKEELSK